MFCTRDIFVPVKPLRFMNTSRALGQWDPVQKKKKNDIFDNISMGVGQMLENKVKVGF